ncbi:MAG: hypothetical protein K6G19_07440 [Lachnospiraceae bacterium]|nr:hypothetical protein [Lachnospiraceae bacterium]
MGKIITAIKNEDNNTDICTDSIRKQTVCADFFVYKGFSELKEQISKRPYNDYIFFISSRDYISVDCIRLIGRKADESNVDIIFSDVLCHDGKNGYYCNLEPARYDRTFSVDRKAEVIFNDYRDRSICWNDLRGKAVSSGLLKSVMKSFDSDVAAQDFSDRILMEKLFSHADKIARAEHAYCFLYDDRKPSERGYFESITTPVGDDFYRYEEIKRKIVSPDTKLVSFDVFDTLLVRDVLEPVDVFRLMDRAFNEKAGSLDHIYFSEIRMACEASCRSRFKKSNPDWEDINLDEIYDEIKLNTVFDSSLIDEMKQLEIGFEHKVCHRRNCGYELYTLALESGKEVIFVSDMYLSGNTVGDILRENGYGGYSHLYMSSEIRKCKWSGKLFEHIKAEYPDVEAGQILHIGDSPAADVDGASHAGINAELLPSGISRFYPGRFEKLYSLDGMLIDKRSAVYLYSGVRLMLAQVLRRFYDDPYLAWNTEADFNADPYLIGYFHLGMNLLGITDWLLNDASRKGYKRIHFLSRDGYLPFEAYRLWAADKENAPEPVYTYMSRNALFFCNIRSKADIYAFVGGVDILAYSPAQVVKLFRRVIPDDKYKAVMAAAGDGRDIDPGSADFRIRLSELGIKINENFRDRAVAYGFIRLLAEELIDYDMLASVRETVTEYLKSVFREGDCIFDLGYSGRTEAALKECLGFPVDSYYVHRFKELSYEREDMGGFEINSFYDYQPVVSFYVREQLFSKIDRRFDGVERDDDGGLRLVFSEDGCPFEAGWVTGMLQDGALQFVSDMKKAADSFAGDVHWRKMDAALPLEYYLHKSRSLDRAFFSCVKFEDDFGSNRSYDMASYWQRDIDERVGKPGAGEIEDLRASLNDVSWRLSETRKSFSYRLGLALTALPRWVREMVMSSQGNENFYVERKNKNYE